MVTLSRLHDEARREWGERDGGVGPKLAGEGSRVGVLDSESAERGAREGKRVGVGEAAGMGGAKDGPAGKRGRGEKS